MKTKFVHKIEAHYDDDIFIIKFHTTDGKKHEFHFTDMGQFVEAISKGLRK